MLQFTGPVQEEWKRSLAEAGVRLYSYIPEHAFIVQMDSAASEQIRSLPFVRWVGLFHPAYRLAGNLRTLMSAGNTASIDAVVETLPDADPNLLAGQIAALNGGGERAVYQRTGRFFARLAAGLPAG